MKLVLIGPPGCGKGTQAVLIQEEYKIPQVSTGDILRAAIRKGTPLGGKAAGYMNAGNLVPDQLIIDLMNERIKGEDCRDGYILDGFPRTLKQAEALDELLKNAGHKLDMVISIEVDDNEVVARLSGRRQCTNCGDGYHLIFKRPKRENVCDKCGSALYQRDDDKEETVRARLSVYREQTSPLINYYQNAGLLKTVNGLGTIDEIFKRVSSLINGHTPLN